jgi:8-oxo-dGTP pyrophosphatase MutT (NUDIX family)
MARVFIAGLVTNQMREILLLKQADEQWHLPMMSADADQAPDITAALAVVSTTGLDGDITGYVGSYSGTTALEDRYDVFLFRPVQSGIISAANTKLGWFHRDNLPAVLPPVAAFLRSHGPSRQHLPRKQWLATTPRSWLCTAAILTDPAGRLIMVKDAENQRWGFVGGMIDSYETAPEAARRELHEETGLDLPVGALLAVGWQHPEAGLDHPIVQFFHDFGTIDPSGIKLHCEDGEIADWGWFFPEHLETLTGRVRASFAIKALSARDTSQTVIVHGVGVSSHAVG